MDLKEEVKLMLASKSMTLTKLAEKMSELSGKNTHKACYLTNSQKILSDIQK